MDAVKLLGSLLGNNALGSRRGGSLLEGLLGGGRSGGAGGLVSVLLGGKGGGSKTRGGLAAVAALLALAAASRSGSGNRGAASRGAAPQSPGGGLGDLLGPLLGGAAAPGGTGGGGPDLGGLLGSLLGGGEAERLGLSAGFGGGDALPPPLSEAAQEGALLLVEAMCLAAKCDGRVDEQELEAIRAKLGEVDPEEAAFVSAKLSSRGDLDEFLSRVPREMGPQVYAVSLGAVRVDSREEAAYFSRLTRGLGLDDTEAAEIRSRLGLAE